VQCLDKDHAVQPVHDREPESEGVLKDQVDRAAAPEDELHRDRTHERRHDEREHAECLYEECAPELEAHGEIRERNRDQCGEYDRQPGDVQAVPERLLHERDLEERLEVRKREAPAGLREGDVDDHADRHDQEGYEEADDQQCDRELRGRVAAVASRGGRQCDGRAHAGTLSDVIPDSIRNPLKTVNMDCGLRHNDVSLAPQRASEAACVASSCARA
jgi:hypothetical protein